MRALDEAVAAAIRAVAPGGTDVFYGSAPQNWQGDTYYVHRSFDSNKSALAGMGTQARQYHHSVVVVSRDPDEAEQLREALTTALEGHTLGVAGWGSSQKLVWEGEEHDPGDMLPGGGVFFFAGDRWTIDVHRQRQR
jgi:hypothetical protein